ncbi:hypothetical protein ACIRVK_43910 [Streptomyces sp. NPDC101152]|uniref:hypothetical protein n=1 Tax=Streptomyces sp. NPDC101152 TaxID=3366116 RepID=UPI003827881D
MQDEKSGVDEGDTDSEQGELEVLLGGVHQVLADLYRHAAQLLEQAEYNRAVVSLIAHAVREISNNLAHHLGLAEGVQLPPRADVTAAMKSLAQIYEAGSHWESLASEESGDGKHENLSEGRDYSIQLREAVQEAVAANAAATGNAQQLRAFVAAWELSVEPTATSTMFGSAFDFFMSYAHLDRVGQDRTPPKAEVREKFAKFETIVAARLRGFFDVGDELAAILNRANSTMPRPEPDHGPRQKPAKADDASRTAADYTDPEANDVEGVVARTGHLQHRRFFYTKLENPNWVAPLTRHQAFKTVPRTDGRSQLSMDGWPEGEYLAKIARLAPDEVFAAVKPALTSDHPVVQRIVLDLAGQLPLEMVVSLLPTIRRYLQLPWLVWLDPLKVVTVVRRLAEGSRTKQARALAQILYRPRPAGDPNADPETTLEPYWYAQTLPDTLAALGTEPKVLAGVVGWLQEWVKAAPYQAYMKSMWRHLIAGDQQLRHPEPVGHALVDGVRDLAHMLVDAGHPLSDIVPRIDLANLDPDDAPIFRRLALNVITYAVLSGPGEAGDDGNLQIAFEYLTTAELLRGQYRPEYLLLARCVLPTLTADQITSWKKLVEEPPHLSPEAVGRMLGGFAGEPTEASAEQIADYVSLWQRDLLAGVGLESLPDALHPWLDDLIARHGQLHEPLDGEARGGFATGPTSPLSDADARGMDPEDLVAFVRTWEPSDPVDWRSVFPASYDGLAGSITRAVSANPERYAAHAEQFIGLRSSYIQALFDGLTQAISQGQGFDWEPVLKLAWHAADQTGDGGQSDTWDFTHQQVARFIQSGTDNDDRALAIPVQHYQATWKVLELLLRSTNPAGQAEDDSGSGSNDPMTESVNTTRPVALRATIHLLAACGKAAVESAPESSAIGIVDEILAALEEHVGPEADDSLAVAAVFGEGIGPLLSFASEWTTTRLARIYGPADGSNTTPLHQAWFDTAWAVTIVGYEPSRGLYEPLKPWYAMRIGQLDTTQPEIVVGISMRSPRLTLADHILVLYVSGQLTDGLHDQVLVDLFAHGDGTILRDALGHLGWRLGRTEGDVSESLLERFRTLWDWRALSVAQAGADPEELLDFYWWIAADRLEAGWWLPHLAAVASDSRFHAHEMLGEPLAKAAADDPEQVLGIFSALYDLGRLTRHSPDLMRHAPAILKPALDSGHPDIVQRAQDLVGRMGQDGHTDLMDRIRGLRD